jgi:hypothetical protein
MRGDSNNLLLTFNLGKNASHCTFAPTARHTDLKGYRFGHVRDKILAQPAAWPGWGRAFAKPGMLGTVVLLLLAWVFA